MWVFERSQSTFTHYLIPPVVPPTSCLRDVSLSLVNRGRLTTVYCYSEDPMSRRYKVLFEFVDPIHFVKLKIYYSSSSLIFKWHTRSFFISSTNTQTTSDASLKQGPFVRRWGSHQDPRRPPRSGHFCSLYVLESKVYDFVLVVK